MAVWKNCQEPRRSAVTKRDEESWSDGEGVRQARAVKGAVSAWAGSRSGFKQEVTDEDGAAQCSIHPCTERVTSGGTALFLFRKAPALVYTCTGIRD